VEPGQRRVGAAERAPHRGVAADRQHLGGEQFGTGRHLRIPEAVEGERRLQHGLGVVGQHVRVGRLGRTQRAGVQAPVRFQHLGVPHGHGVAGTAADGEADDTGHVLTGVEADRAAGRDRALRPERPHHPDGWGHPRLQDRRVDRDDRDRRPARVVEPRPVPARLSVPEVDGAPVVQVGRADLAGRGAPALVGADGDPGTVRQLDLELGEQADLPAVPAAILLPVPAQPAAVPPVAEPAGEHVRAGGEQVGDVVAGDQQPLPVCGPARVQQVVADPDAVEAELVHAERGDVQPGPAGRRRQLERPAQQGDRGLLPGAGIVRQGDRDRLPVRRREQSGLDRGRLAPVRPARVRGHPNPQVPDLPAAQRAAGRDHVKLAGAGDGAGALDAGGELRCRRGFDLVPDLALGGARRDAPVQPERTAAADAGGRRTDGQAHRRPWVGRARQQIGHVVTSPGVRKPRAAGSA
jgi:hypothetical protein